MAGPPPLDDREAGYREGFGRGYSRAITDVIAWLHAHPLQYRVSWITRLVRWWRDRDW